MLRSRSSLREGAAVTTPRRDPLGPGDKYSPSAVEAEWYAWWEKSGFFRPSVAGVGGDSSDEEVFTMMLPPPNVTGTLHLGHALTVAIEDSIARWHRMCGRTTLWNPGCDHAGIATQSVVERTLMRDQSLSRHDLGRDAFVDEVWRWKEATGTRIYEQMKELGASMDWERACFTMDPKFNRAVVEAFVRLHDRGVVYRSSRPVNWSCHLRSALSDIEVDKESISGPKPFRVPGYDKPVVFGQMFLVAYKIVGGDGGPSIPDGTEIVVGTTRPETIFGDVALAVHPQDQRYLHIHGGFAVHPTTGRLMPVVLDGDAVDPTLGTGALKITPAHDPTDYEVGQRHHLPSITVMDEAGAMTGPACGEYIGLPRFDARTKVVAELDSQGLLRGVEPHPMVVPLCSRSGDVVETRVCPQWFVDCEDMARRAEDAVDTGQLQLHPRRYAATWRQWLGNIRPWCVSRQLWWGHRIPAYFATVSGRVHETGQWVVARDAEEARHRAALLLEASAEEILLTQDEDVLDTWFSSALFPFAAFGWPDDGEDLGRFFPGKLLETGHDILFFWVARMVMLSLELTGRLPFEDVYLHAMIRDARGRKMSKSLGNVLEPSDIIDGTSLAALQERVKASALPPAEVEAACAANAEDFPEGIPACGTDALRFALCAYTSQGRDINLSVERVVGYSAFCNKVWNAAKFVTHHCQRVAARNPGARPLQGAELRAAAAGPDAWILSRLRATCHAVNAGFADYNLAAVASAVYNFWWHDLCDVYLECAKPRLAQAAAPQASQAAAADALTACSVLLHCATEATLLLHPMMPFLTEELYHRFKATPFASGAGGLRAASACVAPFPRGVAPCDDLLERNMARTLQMVQDVRSCFVLRCLPSSSMRLHLVAQPDAADREMDVDLGVVSTLTHIETVAFSSAADPGWLTVPLNVEHWSAFLEVTEPLSADAVEQELEKLARKRKKLSKNLSKVTARVSRPEYSERVPPEVRVRNVLVALMTLARRSTDRPSSCGDSSPTASGCNAQVQRRDRDTLAELSQLQQETEAASALYLGLRSHGHASQ